MAKKSKNTDHMDEELLNIIRVTPEQSEEFKRRTVSYTIHPRPEGKKNPKGKMYCPYCGDFKIYKNSREDEGSYKRCVDCSVSEFDYHVRNANHTWKN